MRLRVVDCGLGHVSQYWSAASKRIALVALPSCLVRAAANSLDIPQGVIASVPWRVPPLSVQ